MLTVHPCHTWSILVGREGEREEGDTKRITELVAKTNFIVTGILGNIHEPTSYIGFLLVISLQRLSTEVSNGRYPEDAQGNVSSFARDRLKLHILQSNLLETDVIQPLAFHHYWIEDIPDKRYSLQ